MHEIVQRVIHIINYAYNISDGNGSPTSPVPFLGRLTLHDMH